MRVRADSVLRLLFGGTSTFRAEFRVVCTAYWGMGPQVIGIVELSHLVSGPMASRLGVGDRCVEDRRAPILEPRAGFSPQVPVSSRFKTSLRAIISKIELFRDPLDISSDSVDLKSGHPDAPGSVLYKPSRSPTPMQRRIKRVNSHTSRYFTTARMTTPS